VVILRSGSGSPAPTSKSVTIDRKESVKCGLKRAIVAKENIVKKRKILAISSTSRHSICMYSLFFFSFPYF
ncbi:hypothetical protein TorRG33x02_008410, partial [Trema orientale]